MFFSECEGKERLNPNCNMFVSRSSVRKHFFSFGIWFGLKICFFVILFVVMRAILPRYRYDQLMKLGWKCFLPLALALFILSVGILMDSTGSLINKYSLYLFLSVFQGYSSTVIVLDINSLDATIISLELS